MSDTFNEVKAIIKDLLGADEAKITPEARFREELEADSLDLVELIMAFEDKFGAEISDEVAQKIVTVEIKSGGRVARVVLSRISRPPISKILLLQKSVCNLLVSIRRRKNIAAYSTNGT